jgi:ATP-binding cassette subfamily F protein 3
MLFSGDDVFKPVSGLSGGERSRLALARLVTSRANLLLLDEPTNHLDIPSREALEEALAGYKGTLIFASHDRRLIERLARRLWIVEPGRLVVFDGAWHEYQERRAAAVPAASPKPSASADAPMPGRSPALSEWRRRGLVADLETRIAERERQVAETSAALTSASQAADVARVAALGRLFDDLDRELQELVEEWSRLQG